MGPGCGPPRRECLVRNEPFVVVKGDLDGGADGAEVLFVAVERLLRLDAVGGKTTGAQDGANLRQGQERERRSQ